MAEDVANAKSEESGLGARVLRAGKVLVSAQLDAAQREARSDLSRIGAGLALFGAAIGLVAAAAILLHAAAVLFVQARFGLSWPAALLAVAGADALVAALLAAAARGKLAPPVMAETRAMVKRAAEAIRGN